MPLISWGNELHLGIKSIDDQHHKLVDIINELNDALEQGSANEIIATVLEEASAYTLEHFAYEEKLFKKYQYPDTEEHTESHQNLVDSVVDLQEKLQQGDFMVGIETMEFLKDWLTHHILQTDKAYVPFLLEQGVE